MNSNKQIIKSWFQKKTQIYKMTQPPFIIGVSAVGPYCSSILRARYRTIPSEHAHTLFVEADKLTQLRLIRLSAPPRGRLPSLELT